MHTSITLKKITKMCIVGFGIASLFACNNTQHPPRINALTQHEIDTGWLLLFDGESTKGWRGFKRDDMPTNWIVDGNTLHMKGEEFMSVADKADRADIVYTQPFEHFILKLQWKISPNGNSGIFYLGSETNQRFSNNDYIWRNAPEMQILDNIGHPDAAKGVNGNRQAGSLYDLIAAKPQNAKPVGQWNDIKITVDNRHVTHQQNGVVVVEYTMDTPQWKAMIKDSKFPSLNPMWHDVAKKGLIGLQDHSDPVWFRNIKLKPLIN